MTYRANLQTMVDQQGHQPEDSSEAGQLKLGGNIELAGFSGIDSGSMIILKKIIGNYVRKYVSLDAGFERLGLSMKKVHGSNNYELKARLEVKGKMLNAEHTDRNLFFCIDRLLKKLEKELAKQH